MSGLTLVALIGASATIIVALVPWLKQYFDGLRVVNRHRDPLLRAAHDLQWRLYRILRGQYLADASKEESKVTSTLWLFGQYLGWVEILRRAAEPLNLGSAHDNRRLQKRLARVAGALANPSTDGFVIAEAEQQAIGEAMIESVPTADEEGSNGTTLRPMSYGAFTRQVPSEPPRAQADEPLPVKASRALSPHPQAEPPHDFQGEPPGEEQPESALSLLWRRSKNISTSSTEQSAAYNQLANIQRALVDLVDVLDPHQERFPRVDERAKVVPIGNGGDVEKGDLDEDDVIAQFVPVDPHKAKKVMDSLSEQRRVRSRSGNKTVYKPRIDFGGTYELVVVQDEPAITIWASTKLWPLVWFRRSPPAA